jgi:hypothetical protein
MDLENPKCRIVSAEAPAAERLLNELWKDYSLLTVNIQPIDGKPWITAVMIHKSEIPRPQQMIAIPQSGFRQ